MKKNKPDELRKVQEILLCDWDPIGIGDNPNLADEYDRYIPAVLSLIKENCAPHMLDECLSRIEAELGVTVSSERRRKAVQKLLELGHQEKGL